MNKVIVGFDGSDQANDALQLGASLADAADAELIVASVFEFPPVERQHAPYVEARTSYFDDVFAKATAALDGAQFERREVDAIPGEGLNNLAEEEQAELMVIGSCHLSPMGHVLVGSLGTALFNGAHYGVMVAPRGWAEREHIGLGLIGVGYDGTPESKVALDYACELAKELKAELRLISITPYIDPHLGAVVDVPEEWTETLTEGAKTVPSEIESERVLRQGRPATELALQGVELDMLVVGSRKRGPLRRTVLGSVSSELVRTAPCPVLVVPRGADAAHEGKTRAAAELA